jgi:CDP-glucose 4,6-dehydratase
VKIKENTNDPHETKTLKLDCMKAATIFKWSLEYTIKESFVATIGWYRGFYHEKDFDASIFRFSQLEEYFQFAIKQNREWILENGKT